MQREKVTKLKQSTQAPKLEQMSWEALIEELNDDELAMISGGIHQQAVAGSCTSGCGWCP